MDVKRLALVETHPRSSQLIPGLPLCAFDVTPPVNLMLLF